MLNNFFRRIKIYTKQKFWIKIQKYWRILLIIILIIVLLITFYIYLDSQNRDNLAVRFLDVGQGDSILITFQKINFLIDAGPDDMVISKLEKYLPLFDREIDYIIPTHPDADHITGLINIFRKYSVKNVLENGDMDQTTEISQKINQEIQAEIISSKAKVKTITCGDELIIPDYNNPNLKLHLYFLHPIQNNLNKTETNDNSIVILLNYGDYSFLFTGDISSDTEKKLFFDISKCFSGESLDNIEKNLKNLTVLKVAHHGSNSASSLEFLKKINPVYSIISVGKDNKFGHPDLDVVNRLTKYSKYILMTEDRGDIIFTTNGQNLIVQTTK